MSESWFNTSHDNMATQSLTPEAFNRFKYDMLDSIKKWPNDPAVYRIVSPEEFERIKCLWPVRYAYAATANRAWYPRPKPRLFK